MAGGRRNEIELLLEKLHSCGLQNNRLDPRATENIVVDIYEHLAIDVTPVQFELHLKLLFGDKGVIAFGRKFVDDKNLVDARKSTLDILRTLLEKDATKIVSYVDEIRKYCLFLYNRDKASKVCSTSLEIFCILMEKFSPHINLEDMNIDQYIERLCIDIRSGKGSTLLQQQLRTLGMLLYSYPNELSHHAGLILKVFKDQLQKHMGSKPDLIALAGVFRGFVYYLHHFPKEESAMSAQLYKDLFPSIKKALNPNLNLPRRDSQRACLELIHIHGRKFSVQLFEEYDTMFAWLLKWCGHSNRDDRKAATPAMDTFVVAIADILDQKSEKDDKSGIKVFKFLIQEYNRLLEGSTNTSHVNLAVKGYGLLSGACCRYLSPIQVNTMFNQVLTASQYTFYQSSEMIENKLANLPSYIESLAIIINNMISVNDIILDSVLQLTLSLVEHFPLLASPLRHLAYRAFFTLFRVVYNKAGFLHEFLHSFVYRSVLLTCSHEPDVETPLDSSSNTGSGKWKGLKNEVVTYRTFLPIWYSLMLPEKVANIKVDGMPATVKTELSNILYSKFVICTLEITEKLDLDTFKGSEEKEAIDVADEESATSDPVSGLKAKTPKDFQVYMNLISLVHEVLPLQSEANLEQYVPRLLHYYVRRSFLQPLVSAHYSIITTVLTCSRSTSLFTDREEPKTESIIHLIRSYVVELLQRCRQYRDQLLVSCLTLILQLPNSVVLDIFPELVPPIQMALRLGVSYLPLAEVCVKALQQWSSLLPRDTLHEYFPSFMPLLLPYLRSKESGGQAEVYARAISVKLTFGRQRRKVDQKKMLERKSVDESAMQKVQMSILRLVGSLDPSLSLCVIPQDSDSLAAAAVRWDTVKHIKFAVPFETSKIDVFFDDLLPHVIDLAVNSSDRQTKVAASELLHSVIVFMIGTGTQKSQETLEKYPMAPLYKHVFRAMLQLSCDPDQVTRQLFITLIYQTIHWFTNNRNYENPDTVVLLDTIMEGIESPNDPALRDISAQCLSEFVKWSRKQCSTKNKVPPNLKSILKRMLSFCRHPSAFKRLGGSLAWNSIYREFREDATAVNIWTLEILIGLLNSLELAEEDDPALGTHEQNQTAIQHVERILREKKEVFWKKSSDRRVPPELDEGTMEDVLHLLVNQLGKPKSLIRHKCMELLVTLSPSVKGISSIQMYFEQSLRSHNSAEILQIVEAGGEASLGIRQHQKPKSSDQSLMLKDVVTYLEALLAALDGHSWLLGRNILPLQDFCSCEDVKVFDAVEYFVSNMSCVTVGEYIQKECSVEKSALTLSESQNVMQLKCSVVVRVLDFVSIVLRDAMDVQADVYKKILTPPFFEMITLCVMDPVRIGFDMKDLEVKENLPLRVEEALKIVFKKAPDHLAKEFDSFIDKEIRSTKHGVLENLPSMLSENAPMSLPSKQSLDGLKMLQRTGWLSRSSLVLENFVASLCKWIDGALCPVMNRNAAIDPHPSYHEFLQSIVNLAFTLYPEVQHQFLSLATDGEMVVGSGGKEMAKGVHIMNVLGPSLISFFLSGFNLTMERCLELVNKGDFQGGISFATTLLNYIIKDSSLRKRYSVTVIKGFLNNWITLVSAAGKLCVHNEMLLGILSCLFLIDRENTFKSYLLDLSSHVVIFYKGFLTHTFELQLKTKALKLLPFFLMAPGDVSSSVCDSLNLLSVNHFPLYSTEFTPGGSKDREYHQALIEILTSLELSLHIPLMEFIAKLFCREKKHRYEEALQLSLEKFMKRQNMQKQVETLKYVHNLFLNVHNDQTYRMNVIDLIMMPLLQQSRSEALEVFSMGIVGDAMTNVAAPVSGRDEEQLRVLISMIGSYSVLQVMYSKLPREKLFSPESKINSSYCPTDASGKELTKGVLRCSSKISKGFLRHDQTHQELRRLCACAAYNAVIAVLVCVQNDMKFYTNFLFSANESKDERIWECLVDSSIKHEFDVEVNFNPGSRKKFVALRQSLKESTKEKVDDGAKTVQYIASHYLADSSLRDDLSQFDFNNSVVLAMSQGREPQERMIGSSDMDAELMTLNLDQSDYNGHEVMANLTAVVHHMVDAKIMDLPKEGAKPTAVDVPKWMVCVQDKLNRPETPRNAKLFLLRLIMNASRIFGPYAAHFSTPILMCIAEGTIGDNINYFLSDLLVTLMNWGKEGIPQDSVLGKNYANRVLSHLFKNVPHNRADIFKYNLDVIRSVVENWKSILTVPYSIIFSLMETSDGQNREVEAGLQLLGIVLANELPPHTPGSDSEKRRCRNLLGRLMCSSSASLYGAASELLGLYFKFMKSQEEDVDDLEDAVLKRIKEMINEKQGQALTCVYNIHKHYSSFSAGLMNKLLNLLPKLYGIHRTHILECVVSYCSKFEDVFASLKEQNLTETLTRKEPATQLVALQMVKEVMPRLSPPEMLYFMPSIVSFVNHPAPKCREHMYDVLFWIYDNYGDSIEERGQQLESEARGVLLEAINDQDAILKQKILNFWIEGSRSLALPERLLHILRKLYSPESEDSFLPVATYVLLEATSRSADYQRSMFDQPLTECRFREMRVSTAWQARHASMVPLFADSQAVGEASFTSYISLTQGSDIGDSAVGRIQATQQKAFAETVQPGGSFNWVTGSTFDTTLADMEYEVTHTSGHGSSGGLLFTVGSSEKRDMSRYKNPSLGKSRMQPANDGDTTDSASVMQSKLIRRRFVKNQDREKQSIYFAKLEYRRKNLRETLTKERKSRREAQVTMYRQYRVGELPDVQIPYKAMIAPLQALAQRDSKVAGMLFELLAQGIIENMEFLLSQPDVEGKREDIYAALNNIIASSFAYSPQLLKTVCHLMINNKDIVVDPEVLSVACLDSHLEPLGILILERQALLAMKQQTGPPARKKRRTDSEMLPADSSLWLNMAELYKSLDMWDAVCGIVHEKLGTIKDETRLALEAEASNNPTQAYVQYRQALMMEEWEEQPTAVEERIWKDWYANCAEMLGQWGKLETFIEDEFLKQNEDVDLERVWLLPRPTSVVLPALINSKLMKILDGSSSDGNLVEFVNKALENSHHKMVLENMFPLQLAVLATHQENVPKAQSYLNTTMMTTLESLSHHSILTPKPLRNTLRNAQLITELSDFLKSSKYGMSRFTQAHVKRALMSWEKQAADPSDNPVLLQQVASYRDLYLHYFKNERSEIISQLIKDVRISTHVSVIKAALQNSNAHLADRHLRKLKAATVDDDHSLARFYFMMTENHMIRASSNEEKCLQYLVEAWGKFMSKANAMPLLSRAADVEVQYLRLESALCFSIAKAIHSMGDEWDQDNEFVKCLEGRFPGLQNQTEWYKELLKCGFNDLVQAVSLTESKLSDIPQEQGIYMKLASYCENCLESWSQNIDITAYSKHLIITILKAMALGDRDAHFKFPCLINLLAENPAFVDTFISYSKEVPEWMFLLWLNHILIYIDKEPGPALQPIVKKLTELYPHAMVYPFRISMQQYNFDGNIGKAAKAMCLKVEALLQKNTLFNQFTNALSLVVVPYIVFKEAFGKLSSLTNKTEIENELKNIEENHIKINNRSVKGTVEEKGEVFLNQDVIRKEYAALLYKSFGQNFKGIRNMNIKEIKDHLKKLSKPFSDATQKNSRQVWKHLPKQLKSYSPWLANFRSSRFSDVLELPGQYTGLSKPLPEYHIKVSNFDENVLPMSSLRVPMRIIIRGSDEKDHKFLVKWGEDLRTDQRMEQVFVLMNKIYASSPLCAKTTSCPYLDTFQVIPVSLQVGLLQWVDSTMPLKDFMVDSLKEGEADLHNMSRSIYGKQAYWDPSTNGKERDVVKTYEEAVNKLPWDMLRRSILKLASSSEGFFSLRSTFAVSYATMCISHWLVGIGDRHCGNTLVNLKTGRVVGIDFGHHFESSTQFLPVPELMPFRLTPQISNVFQPIGAKGMLKEIMIASLGALRSSHHVLLAVLQAFVKEPTEDWLNFVRKAQDSTQDEKVELFSQERIRILKGKLSGMNPTYVLRWAVNQNVALRKNKRSVQSLVDVVIGSERGNLRAKVDKSGLSPHDQVDVLLDLACDPNILGRTWIGWEPFL